MSYTLTADQQTAYSAIVDLVTSNQTELVLLGGAGVGKTTLVKTFIDEWPTICQLSAGALKDMPVVLTATTNKAADALSMATGRETKTIHSALGLRVENKGFRKTEIVDNQISLQSGVLYIVDESSFVDTELLGHIRAKAKMTNSKVVYLGDHCQLKPVGSKDTPVFNAGIKTVELNEIVRQADSSPIKQLSLDLRAYVDGGPMPRINIDGVNLIHMDKENFIKSLIADCQSGQSTRALSWTNERAKEYNRYVIEALKGRADIGAGDELTVNKQVQLRGVYKLPTDSTVRVVSVGEYKKDRNNIQSREVEISTGYILKQALNQWEVDGLIKDAYACDEKKKAYMIENHYVDLRLAYASTVNKAQGSTYDNVYIDLNDIGKCYDKDQVRRMLYVALSRARHKAVFTGDI